MLLSSDWTCLSSSASRAVVSVSGTRSWIFFKKIQTCADKKDASIRCRSGDGYSSIPIDDVSVAPQRKSAQKFASENDTELKSLINEVGV